MLRRVWIKSLDGKKSTKVYFLVLKAPQCLLSHELRSAIVYRLVVGCFLVAPLAVGTGSKSKEEMLVRITVLGIEFSSWY